VDCYFNLEVVGGGITAANLVLNHKTVST
jgi:hypothetical protein